MIRPTILCVLTCVLLIGCSQKKEENDTYQKITIRTLLRKSESIKDTTLYRKHTDANNTIYEYIISKSDSTYFHLVTKEMTSDSSIKLFNETCKLVDTATFQFKGERVKIFKYFYDVEGSMDEEHDYYFSNKYGLVFSKSVAWRYPWEFYNEEELKPLQDSILNNIDKFKSSNN